MTVVLPSSYLPFSPNRPRIIHVTMGVRMISVSFAPDAYGAPTATLARQNKYELMSNTDTIMRV